jgi:hypothetical protein
MTSISNQTVQPPYRLPGTSTLTPVSRSESNSYASAAAVTGGQGDTPAPAGATSADAIAAAIAASANSSSYTFAQVAQNARTTLDSNLKAFGKTPDDSTTGAQWNQIFGTMDRRSLFAISSNQGGQFSSQEQGMASFTMSQQISNAQGNASTGSNADDAAAFGRSIAFLQNVGPEEKQSPGWAMNMASAKTAYNAEASDAGLPPDSTYTDPLVKVLMAALKAAQSDPSKDRTVGQQSTLADIKGQPWAQGFGDQIDAAYAASRPQGVLVNVQA